MTEYKSIICFANSYRDSGRCFAGKDIKTGEWVRPICSGDSHSIPRERQKLPDESYPKLLDVIKVPVGKKASLLDAPYQTENWFLDERPWEKIGAYRYEDALKLVDEPESLWLCNKSLGTDEVHEDSFGEIKPPGSLLLLQLSGVMTRTPKLRARFNHNGVDYDLAVTCPEAQMRYADRKVPTTNGALCCLSLAEPFVPYRRRSKFAYKLVAGMMFPMQ